MKLKSMSAPVKCAAVNFLLFAFGAGVITITYAVFRRREFSSEDIAASAPAESYELFFRLSLAVIAIFLILTLLSRITTAADRENRRKFGRLIASASPTVCQILIVLISVFYAYITSGGSFCTAPYVLLTGIGEALILRLTAAISALCEVYKNKNN